MRKSLIIVLSVQFVLIGALGQAGRRFGSDTNQISGVLKSGRPPELRITKAYRAQALGLLLQEANEVAKDLALPEKLPITEADLVGAYITPPYYARELEAVGNVTTRGYGYYVSYGYKFSNLVRNGEEMDFHRWIEEYRWPTRLIDTKAAYQMATQWLAAVSVDVARLNRDYKMEVSASAVRGFWLRRRFTPVYWIVWPRKTKHSGCVAEVRLFAPTRTLMQLDVTDPRYILCAPLQLTNSDAVTSEAAPAGLHKQE